MREIAQNLSLEESLFENDEIIRLRIPEEFNFNECLVYMNRFRDELLHKVEGDKFIKLLSIHGQFILIEVAQRDNRLEIRFMNGIPEAVIRKAVATYIHDLFDLGLDIKPFYDQMQDDFLLGKLIKDYYGLRLVAIPDFFESVTWTITGQQVSLHFSNILKTRFIETFGESYRWNNRIFYLYPNYQKISRLEERQITNLGFSKYKADYIIAFANEMRNGNISKYKLTKMDSINAIRNTLLSMPGIGRWSAEYIMMKTFKVRTALPIDDVGLHNAIKTQLELDRKPTIKEIEQISGNWRGWEAYCVFYLWRSLIQ